ncbi:hypothetical protein ACFXHA_03380 [Nocardia sp. NPDC059240]|uniref:protein kinase domain-containing protein n=1 Tax=Nocardia sp. NPDC059240 TaxID=3346786 RepID=UPI0036858984
MNHYLPDGRRITLKEPAIGSGAEGFVYAIREHPDLCAKIYLEKHDRARSRRLTALMRTKPARWDGDHADHTHVAWPVSEIRNDDATVTGFLMPIVDGKKITTLFDPVGRADAVDDPTWRVLLAVAARTARLLDMLHEAGIVVGDVSPSNVLVTRTGHVTLIDCDAVQFIDPKNDRLYPNTKLTPEYAPPTASIGGHDRLTAAHDDFGLAIMVCQMLMEGDHPYEGVLTDADPDAPDPGIPENIQQRNNRILTPDRFVEVSGGLPATVLPPEVRKLAETCFAAGYSNPTARPTAREWAEALDRAGYQLIGCEKDDNHVYHTSLTACPWCTDIIPPRPAPPPTPPTPSVPLPPVHQPEPEKPSLWDQLSPASQTIISVGGFILMVLFIVWLASLH